jgi:hypothetical protein
MANLLKMWRSGRSDNIEGLADWEGRISACASHVIDEDYHA